MSNISDLEIYFNKYCIRKNIDLSKYCENDKNELFHLFSIYYDALVKYESASKINGDKILNISLRENIKLFNELNNAENKVDEFVAFLKDTGSKRCM